MRDAARWSRKPARTGDLYLGKVSLYQLSYSCGQWYRRVPPVRNLSTFMMRGQAAHVSTIDHRYARRDDQQRQSYFVDGDVHDVP